jgi:predicted Zn-dependent peptidase
MPWPLAGQARVGREAAEDLRFPPLRFHAPEPKEHKVDGVSVLFLEDHAVPLVTLYARFKGGYSLLDRSYYAAASALPSLLRYGGTETLPPDSVDGRLAYYAIQTTFGGGGETLFTSMNTLTEYLGPALSLWGDMLRRPRFDTAEVDVWRGRELEAVRRRGDDPQRLAFGEFNRLLYGDHPVGWEMDTLDLSPERLSPRVIRDVQGRILCPENLILGVTGDVSWDELKPQLHRIVAGWPACADTLLSYPEPDIRKGPGVFLIPRKLDQAVLVMAHATDVHMGLTPEYFAAQIGNSILGSGGFSSRILSQVRTEEGFAYSAASLWTMPHRYQGLLGAVTRTKPENAVPALKLILSIMEGMTEAPPTRQEMETTVDQIVNGFVFNFETPGQIVARRMFYLAQGLPKDWLERYVEGIEDVTPRRVERVFKKYLHPDEMIIMVVGDPDRIGREALATLGPVTVLDIPPGGGPPGR